MNSHALSLPPRRRGRLAVAAFALAAVALAACGSDEPSAATPAPTVTDAAPSSSAPATDPTATDPATTDPAATSPTATDPATTAPVTTESIDLSGVTLRFGDTSDDHVRLVFEGSGQIDELPYKVEWSTFQTGPALIAAETGGSVDLGKMSETPLIFAQAAGSPVKAVWAGHPIDPATSSLGILVPVDSDLQTVADLKGKRIGYAPGTVLEYLLANALGSVGLTVADVTPIAIQPGIDLLATDNADAVLSGASGLSTAVVNGTAHLLASGAEFTPGFYYLTASNSALDDPAVSAAIGDFAQRLELAEKWYNGNVDDAVELVAELSLATPEVARDIITRAPVGYGPITNEIIAAHQSEIDFFVDSGVLTAPLDAAEAFDQRFGSE